MIALYSDKTTTIDVVFTVAGGLVTDGFTATVKLNGKVYSIPSVSAGSFKVEIPSSDFSGRTDGSYFEIIVTVADGSGKEVLKLKEMGVLEKSTAQYVANTSNELRAFLQPEFKVPNIGPDGSGTGSGSGCETSSSPIVDVLPNDGDVTSDEIDAVAGVRYNVPASTVSQLVDGITVNLPMPSEGQSWNSLKVIDFKFDGSEMTPESIPVIFKPDGSVNSISDDCGVIDGGKTVFSTAVFNGTNWDVFWTQGELKTNPF